MQALFARTPGEGSILRHIDARTKLAVTLATALATVCCSGFVSQLVLFASTLIYALLLRRAGLLTVLYALMAVMMALSAGCGLLLGHFAPMLGGVTLRSLVIPFLRGLSMMNAVIVLAMTTRVEDLLATLERIRLPFCVFLPTAVMLRFIPTFASDIKQVWETLKIKGWPLGPAMLTFRPLLSARLILAPILFRALKSSETLGVASELKGLGSAKRTIRADGRTFTSLDARILSAIILAVILVVFAELCLHDLWMPAAASGGMR